MPGRLVFSTTADGAASPTERLRITSAGLVGIGNSSPSAALDVTGNSKTSTLQIGTNPAAVSIGVLGIPNQKRIYGRNAANSADVNILYIDGSNGMVFGPGDAAVIDSSGRLGIGTTSPTDTNGFGQCIDIRSSTGAAIYLRDSDDTTNDTFVIGRDNADSYLTSNSGNILFSNAGSERMRIDSSGRLLVGTSTARNTGVASAPNIGATFEKGGGYNAIAVVGNTNGVDGAYISLLKSRGTTTGATTIVSSEDYLGAISFEGTDGTNPITAAQITCRVDGTPGANDMPGRLVFSTTADGASSPTERMRISQTGGVRLPDVYNQTIASSANVFIDTDGTLKRATSSIKYKTDVETLQDEYADAVLNCRPVWYRSTNESDNRTWGWWGFIAEEVAEIDPRLVQWKTIKQVVNDNGSRDTVPLETPEPENVAYDRFVPHLLNLIKRQGEAIAELQAEVAALKGA
jgi:hypothetical protein